MSDNKTSFQKLTDKCVGNSQPNNTKWEQIEQIVFPVCCLALSYVAAKKFKEGLDKAALESTSNE
jgi:hypothetical protein